MTPIRRQYLKIKQRYPDTLLLFRLGDFYETFDEDSHIASEVLNIVLTSRSMGKGAKIPMAGIPAHALETYLGKLIKAGYKVAICEQLSDPAASHGLVDRDVVRVVTPGTVVESSLLDQASNNYLAALTVSGDSAGLAYVDVSTGEFAATQLGVDALPLELERISPAEVVVPRDQDGQQLPAGAVATPLSASSFSPVVARCTLLDHFGVVSLEAFGCENLPLATAAAGAIIEYLAETQKGVVKQMKGLTCYSTATFMILDPQTRRNLEIFEGGRWGDQNLSLLHCLDVTRTPMGARLLRRWLSQPLLDLPQLMKRQDGVGWFCDDMLPREKTRTVLSRIVDMERVLTRVRLGTALPREMMGLKVSLHAAAEVIRLLHDSPSGPPDWLPAGLHPCSEVVGLIERAIEPEPGGLVGDGGVVRAGLSERLDEARLAASDARQYIAQVEAREREYTGIRNLKVGYNRVFGYYIEVRNSHAGQVPESYQRRQTLVGAERYITPELKEYESRVLHAREEAAELEKELYHQLCAQVAASGESLTRLASAVAHLDVCASLAEVAARHGYVRPELTEDSRIEIKDGRHPVVERVVPIGTYVPNDTYLDTGDHRLVLLTGPNMSGKSTYIRHVAIITLMAQIGSYVPASSATIGLVDRIFTRVGLQDDLATGQSTFMVEMVETATILNQATSRSLVVLDEIGRGTSTYDGMSIARAVAEYIHSHPRLGCRSLFATHYHELTQLASTLPGVRNHSVAVSEEDGRVVFLHRILPGSADRSYGVQVARLAGLPQVVTNRAWEILTELEAAHPQQGGGKQAARKGRSPKPQSQQLTLMATSDLSQELLSLDLSGMTPLEALNKLYALQQAAQGMA